jgi:predicted PurR-regulated permease PerM
MIIGALVTLVAMLLGVPGAIFLGILAGALEMIPSFGPFLAAVPAVLVALVSGSVRWDMPNLLFAILVGLAYAGIQVFENNLIGPKVLGEALRVPGLVVMIAITVGFQTAGILGAILAVPVVASVRVLTRYAWWKVTGVDLATRATVDTSREEMSIRRSP